MAQIQNRKGNFYSQKQFIRDELSAPLHLESAGDVLIKQLSKKQLNTCITLEEQLETVQNFEKGFDLNPDNRKGITCLEEYKKHELTQSGTSSSSPSSSSKQESNWNFQELMKVTGLTRHELELGLCEKPNSTISQLYMFAIANRKRKCGNDNLGSNHPLNQLKKIEEECFGEKKKSKDEAETLNTGKNKVAKRKKHRKRKRKSEKCAPDNTGKNVANRMETSVVDSAQKNVVDYMAENFVPETKKNVAENTGKSVANSTEKKLVCSAEKPDMDNREKRIADKTMLESESQIERPISPKERKEHSRVSLWDVKDMKKWSECKKIGCRPPAFYTIKNGKIIKLTEKSETET